MYWGKTVAAKCPQMLLWLEKMLARTTKMGVAMRVAIATTPIVHPFNPLESLHFPSRSIGNFKFFYLDCEKLLSTISKSLQLSRPDIKASQHTAKRAEL